MEAVSSGDQGGQILETQISTHSAKRWRVFKNNNCRQTQGIVQVLFYCLQYVVKSVYAVCNTFTEGPNEQYAYPWLCIVYGVSRTWPRQAPKIIPLYLLTRLRKTSGNKRENWRKAQFEGTGQGHASAKVRTFLAGCDKNCNNNWTRVNWPTGLTNQFYSCFIHGLKLTCTKRNSWKNAILFCRNTANTHIWARTRISAHNVLVSDFK
jgi:hypothetical protein